MSHLLLHQRKRSKKSLSDEYGTGIDLFNSLCKEHKTLPEIDVCATAENTKCRIYFDKKYDALTHDWNLNYHDYKGYADVFCNPPQSKAQAFIKKAYEQNIKHNLRIMMLIPINSTVTKAGKALIWKNKRAKIFPVLPTPKFLYNGKESKSSARNRYCVVMFYKR